MSVCRLFGSLAVIALSGLLLACPHRIPEPPDALKTPEAVLSTMDSRIKSVKSLAVEARASYYGDGKARKGTLEIAVERPESLFFAVLSPTGDMLSVLASDGRGFTSFERGGSVCVRGCSTPDNIARLIPLALRGVEAVSVLLGVVPLIKSRNVRLSWSKSEGAYVVTIDGEDSLVQRIWIEHGTGVARRSEVKRGDKVVMELSYEKTAKVSGIHLPHRLRVKMAQGNTDLQLDYRDVEVNPATLTKQAFQLSCPAGTQVKDLGCPIEGP